VCGNEQILYFVSNNKLFGNNFVLGK